MKPETQNWLSLAKEDYESCLYLFAGHYHPQAVYHLCQAIEKLLKATYIEICNQVPKKIHNLRTLGKQSGLHLSEDQIKILTTLTKHYERVRYRDIGKVHYNAKAKVEPIIRHYCQATIRNIHQRQLKMPINLSCLTKKSYLAVR